VTTAAHRLDESLGFRRTAGLDSAFEPGGRLFAYRLDL
jgi:hypothetical protein